MLDVDVDEAALATGRAEAERARREGRGGPQTIEIDVFGDVAPEMADRIEHQLSEAPHADAIEIIVDSLGGDFAAAFDSYARIVRHPARTKIARIRYAASGALLIAMAADRRVADPCAHILIHAATAEPPAGERWTASQHAEQADFLRRLDGVQANLFAYRTGRSPEIFTAELKTEAPSSLDWCLTNGVINGIATSI